MLTVYTENEREKWDAIVRSFSDYDVYYLSGYVRGFQIHGDGEPLLFCYEGKDLRGINVVMKRDVAKDAHFAGKIPEGKYFDFATPYGYGGWLIEGEGDSKLLFEEYEHWCRKHGIISEFVRFHPVLRNHVYAEEAYEVVPLGETVAMDLSSPEAIWENLAKSNRKKIKKAEREGVRVYHSSGSDRYDQFQELYAETMSRDNATSYYYFKPDFFESICDDLPENAQVFYATNIDGEIISANIIIGACGRLNAHLLGSKIEYRNLSPDNLLLYKIALWGNANGYRTFHMGGGVGSKEDGVLEFKRSFYKGELNRFHIGKKVLREDLYNELMDLRRLTDSEIDETTFFPAYRGGARLSKVYIFCAGFGGGFIAENTMESRREAA